MAAKCPSCGVPRIISRTHRWENGCIVNRADGSANFSIYEASFHNGVFEELERRLGSTINRMVYIAGRIAAAEIARNLFTAKPAAQRLIFRTPLYRLTQKCLLLFTRSIGMGRIELLTHRRGKEGAVRVTDPFHLAHCTAVILGGLDVMYGFPVSFTARVEGESYIGELIPGKRDSLGSDEAYRRLTSEKLLPSPLREKMSFSPCRRCGAPSELGQSFCFDLESGVITERETGDRHIFYGHQSLHAILREFELELGPEVRDLFVKAEKDSFSAKLAGNTDYDLAWRIETLRPYLALRGMGFLSHLEDGRDGASLEVLNAFVPTVVVGRVAALWEKHRGKPARYAYRTKGSTLLLRITPAT